MLRTPYKAKRWGICRECGPTGLFVGWLQGMWAQLHRMRARGRVYLQRMWAHFCLVCGSTR